MSIRWSLGYLAVPGVLSLITFLAFSSQWLFSKIEPEPLTRRETIIFNSLIVILLICYARAILTNPGYTPKDWKPTDISSDSPSARQRWCRKCQAYKPPRAHHCKICKRCIPKMDHHCPWTVNCVSHITYPHFLRFVGYADAAILYLEYFLYVRAAVIWDNRDMPSVSLRKHSIESDVMLKPIVLWSYGIATCPFVHPDSRQFSDFVRVGHFVHPRRLVPGGQHVHHRRVGD